MAAWQNQDRWRTGTIKIDGGLAQSRSIAAWHNQDRRRTGTIKIDGGMAQAGPGTVICIYWCYMYVVVL